jgi:hypothetical protein
MDMEKEDGVRKKIGGTWKKYKTKYKRYANGYEKHGRKKKQICEEWLYGFRFTGRNL